MKLTRHSTLGVALAAALWVVPPAVRADSLTSERISADAQWILHANLAKFRTSQVGQYVQTNYLDGMLRDVSAQVKFDVAALVEKFTSVTAYGNDFKKEPEANLTTGILLLQTDAEGQKIVQGALAAGLLSDTNSPLKLVHNQPYPLYAWGQEVFGTLQPNGVILIGKSRDRLDHAARVLAGTSPNLASTKTLAGYSAVPDSLLFLGMADGFNRLAIIPPQAKVMQMADGVRFVLGERSQQLFVELALKSHSQEVVTQIQQVLQGIVALFSLGQPQDLDLTELIKSTRVNATDKLVALGIEFPVDRALARLTRLGKEESEAPPKPKKPKRKKVKKNPEDPAQESRPESPAPTEAVESK